MTPTDPYSSPEPPRVDAGWYPVDGNTQRYWDGYEWTENLAPLTAGQQLQNGLRETDRLYSAVMHIGGIFVSFIVPLIMWLVRKNDSEFIDFHGRQAINFQISMAIYFVISFLLIFVGIGIILLPIVVLLDLIFGIVAGAKASNGEYYRIPIAIPFL